MWENLPVDFHVPVKRATFAGWHIPHRCIPDHELVLVTKGIGRIFIENTAFDVAAGDLLYFYPGLAHSLTVTTKPYMEVYGVHFGLPGNMEKLPLGEVSHLDFPTKIEGLFKTMHEICRQKPHLYRWQLNLVVQRILCEIFTALHSQTEPIGLARVRKVLAYIHEDLSRPISLETMLTLAGVRKTVFMESFRTVTGTTPGQYVRRLRLEKAGELLTESTAPVAMIAEQCGFADSFYFSRCFKEHYGLSPLAYRKEAWQITHT